MQDNAEIPFLPTVLDLLRHFLFFFLWLIICHFGRPLGGRSENWTALGGSGFFEASEGIWMKLHLIQPDNHLEIRCQCGRQRGPPGQLVHYSVDV